VCNPFRSCIVTAAADILQQTLKYIAILKNLANNERDDATRRAIYRKCEDIGATSIAIARYATAVVESPFDYSQFRCLLGGAEQLTDLGAEAKLFSMRTPNEAATSQQHQRLARACAELSRAERPNPLKEIVAAVRAVNHMAVKLSDSSPHSQQWLDLPRELELVGLNFINSCQLVAFVLPKREGDLLSRAAMEVFGAVNLYLECVKQALYFSNDQEAKRSLDDTRSKLQAKLTNCLVIVKNSPQCSQCSQ